MSFNLLITYIGYLISGLALGWIVAGVVIKRKKLNIEISNRINEYDYKTRQLDLERVLVKKEREDLLEERAKIKPIYLALPAMATPQFAYFVKQVWSSVRNKDTRVLGCTMDIRLAWSSSLKLRAEVQVVPVFVLANGRVVYANNVARAVEFDDAKLVDATADDKWPGSGER